MKKNLYHLILLCLITIGCSSNEESCGCNSPTLNSISDENNVTGNISYKKKIDGIEEYYIDRFWTTVRYSDCANCIDFYIVCNEDILDSSFDTLKESDTNEFYEVQFSGGLKEVCNKIISPSDVNYNHITLTKIEKL